MYDDPEYEAIFCYRLTWKARNVPMKELPHLLSYAHKVNRKGGAGLDESTSSTASVLFTEIIRVIEARWVEVDNVDLLCGFLHYYPSIFSEQFVRNLEDKAMELSENWTGQDITKVGQHIFFSSNASISVCILWQ